LTIEVVTGQADVPPSGFSRKSGRGWRSGSR